MRRLTDLRFISPVVALLVLITATAHLIASSGLSEAGNWASIAAAMFAFLLIAAGVVAWLHRRRRSRRFPDIELELTLAGFVTVIRQLDATQSHAVMLRRFGLRITSREPERNVALTFRLHPQTVGGILWVTPHWPVKHEDLQPDRLPINLAYHETWRGDVVFEPLGPLPDLPVEAQLERASEPPMPELEIVDYGSQARVRIPATFGRYDKRTWTPVKRASRLREILDIGKPVSR